MKYDVDFFVTKQCRCLAKIKPNVPEKVHLVPIKVLGQILKGIFLWLVRRYVVVSINALLSM